MRTQPREVAPDGDVDLIRGSAGGVVEVDVASLLIDDRAAARTQALDIEVRVPGDPDGLGLAAAVVPPLDID